MRINSINNDYNNNNFKGITVAKDCGVSKLKLLCNKNIRNAAQKYEVVVKKGAKQREVDKDIVIRFGNALMFSGIGTAGALIPAVLMEQPQLLFAGLFTGMVLGVAHIFSAIMSPTKTVNTLSVQAGRKIVDGDIVGGATQVYDVENLKEVPDLVKIIES